MMFPQTTRRTFLGLAAAATGAAALSACGTSGPGSSSGGAAGGPVATTWGLTGKPLEAINQNSFDAFGKLGKGTIKVTLFENDAYKTKIRTAIGAGQAPTLIYGWGGGILKSYVDAKQVDDLSSWVDSVKGFKDRFLPSTWGTATFDNKVYGVPYQSAQPIMMYYNTEVLAKAGVDVPQTWDDLMKAVSALNAKGVAPISLGGQSKWTSMMWLEYLLDRIGGPEVFEAIFANKPNAWSDPAVIETCTKVQELVKANGFVKGFSSVAAENNADQALLYTGKAAMMLHGGWVYGNMKSANPAFVAKSLKVAGFPTVSGGKGDAKNIVGNPSNYLSINAKATEAEKNVAKAYLSEGLFTDADVKAFLDAGMLPVVTSAKDKIKGNPDETFLQFNYDLVQAAPHFQQSWDQALSPTQADTLLTNIDKLFLNQVTPQQFATAMNATIGK